MIIPLIRTLILYFLVVTAIRIMGKRQIGEMQPSELVVAIMISDLASIPMQDTNIPLISGVVPVLTLLVAEVFMSFLCLKSMKIRKLFTGEPSIIIYDGKILESELKKLRFSLSDLSEQLRISGAYRIGDVEVAVLETNGQLSVIKKEEPLTAKDLGINLQAKKLPCLLVMDGEINSEELRRCQKDEKWLMRKLKDLGAKELSDVFVFEYTKSDDYYLQMKGEK